MPYHVVPIFLLIGFASTAYAEDPISDPNAGKSVYEMDLSELMNAVVTTPGRISSRIEEAPGSVTVITKEQIADLNAQSLREVLSVYVPGVDSIPTYFSYGDDVNDATFSRGLFSDWSQQTLVLVNGRTKLVDSTWSSPVISLLTPLENIDRIEVSRSPVPLYGGGAFLVINLITKEQFLHSTQATTVLGITGHDSSQTGPQSKRASVVAGIDLTPYWHAGVSLHYLDDRGQPAPVGTPGADGRGGFSLPPGQLLNGTQQSLHAGFTLNSNDNMWNFETFFASTRRDPYLTGLVPSPALALYGEQAAYWFANLAYHPIENLSIVASMQTNTWNAYYDFDGVPFGSGDRDWDAFIDATYNLQAEGAGHHNAVIGLRLEREGQYDSWSGIWSNTDNHAGIIDDHSAVGAYGPNLSRNVLGIYAEENYTPVDPVTVTAGLRYDLFGGFLRTDNIVNPRVAVVWRSGSGFVLKGQYSSASRAPSLFERTGRNAPPLFGNSNIKPERVWGAELSALYRAESFKIQLTGFYQQFQDKIQFLPVSPTNFPATNAGSATIPGGDLEFWYFYNARTYAFINGTYLYSTDTVTHGPTNYLPHTYVNAGINLNSSALGVAGLDDKLNINVTGYFRDRRIMPNSLPINRANASRNSFRGAASLTYRFLSTARAFVTLDNFTDERTRIPLSVDNEWYTMNGRMVLVGIVVGTDDAGGGFSQPSVLGKPTT